MKVITWTSLKGGVGKSSVSLNIAGRKALKNKLLYIDIDEQKNATSVLRTEKDNLTIYDVLTSKAPIKDAIKQSRFKNIDYIPGSQKISTLNVDKLEIKKQLQEIYKDYEYVFIDTPPSSNLSAVQSAYVASNEVFIPTVLDKFSSANLMTVVNEVRKNNYKVKIKIIPNMMVTNSKLHKQVLKELKEYMSAKEGIEIAAPLPNAIEISNQMMENKLLINAKLVNKLRTALKKLADKEVS